jgi:hypothetical protein
MKSGQLWIGAVLSLSLLAGGCSSFRSTIREVAGFGPSSDPSVNIKAEPRWLLVKNPRFGDVPSEPEYIWVEEDKVPTTVRTVLLGKRSILASPEVVGRYGPPPGGGRISARQGVPYQVEETRRQGGSGVVTPSAAVAPTASAATAPVPTPLTPRGYVVFVDTSRIVIDLTGQDGLRPGTVVSVRRDKTPIVHPVTGELLGELDEEVGVARVTEIREKFSVAEIQAIAPGSQIQVKDRAVPK